MSQERSKNPWYEFIKKSKTALALEKELKPKLIEHQSLPSTANTNVFKKIINLDVSQPPLKCALSYSYELKNIDNSMKYRILNSKAKKNTINQKDYVDAVFHLEAEAAYFRCEVFRELKIENKDFPLKKEYLELYDKTKTLPKDNAINEFVVWMQKHGQVRKYFSAKLYYEDLYSSLQGIVPRFIYYDQIPIFIENKLMSLFKKKQMIEVECVDSKQKNTQIKFYLRNPDNIKDLQLLSTILGPEQIELFPTKIQINLEWLNQLYNNNHPGFLKVCSLIEKNDKEFKDEISESNLKKKSGF
jgi:hypothetical protein